MGTSIRHAIIPGSLASNRIYLVRETRIMLGTDLAILYGISNSNLNKAVSRNRDRFPRDFMFRLTAKEHVLLIFQSGIAKPRGRGGTRYLPYAFTEQGVAMLSTVLRSERAVHVNIAIMRAFVELRRAVATNEELRKKSNSWNVATMRNSKSFLVRSNRCWSRQRSQDQESDFTLFRDRHERR